MVVRQRVACSARRFYTTAASNAGVDNPALYCQNLVRKYDYESFLAGPFYTGDLRNGFFALKAFSVELATIQDNVSSPAIGQMRMQFWRDAIKGIADGRPPRHPVALALYELSRKARLPSYHLKRIVDARDAELQTSNHLTTDALLSHAESTSSTLIYLLLSMLNVSNTTVDHAASHLGAAQTLATLIRALPYHAINGRMVIPAEITAKHGVVQEQVFRQGGGARGIDEAVFELATLANDHLNTARSMFKEGGLGGKVPRAAMPVFLAGVPTANILGRLEKANFDAFVPQLQVRDWKLPWQVWKGYYTRIF